MATILLATEADEGMGHVAPWQAFVRQALQQGHRVHMAAPNVGLLEQTIGCKHAIGVWPSPRIKLAWSGNSGANSTAVKSWPELLVSLGYAQPQQLLGVVKAWCNLLRTIAPTVIFADYAPGLVLAARILKIAVIEVGTGYCVPPLAPQLRSFPGVRHDAARVAQADALLCEAFNYCLQAYGLPPIATLAETQAWPRSRVVKSPKELDHYGPRDDVVYLGLLAVCSDQNPDLKESPSKWPFVIGYLKSTTPGLKELIAQLNDAKVSALIYIAEMTQAVPPTQGSVTLTNRPIDLDAALSHAAVYLSNGGLHGVGLALSKGCWPVVVPEQAEQVAMARNLAGRNWGSVWLANSSQSIGPQIQALISSGARHLRFNLGKGFESAEQVLLGLMNSRP